MYWLGYDPKSVKEKEIGARAHFFKKNHHTANHFVQQMSKSFGLIRKVLLPEGYVCIVIGRSRIHGRIVDNASIVEDVAERAGYDCVFRAGRVLAKSRKSFNLSYAGIKTEHILVFQRR